MDKDIYRLYKEQLETPWDKPWVPEGTDKEDYTSALLSMLSMPDGEILITVVGIENYSGTKPFEIGKKVRLIKESDNKYDSNAIAVYCENFGLCGYVANNDKTVKNGTYSADILGGGIGEGCFAEVLWTDKSFVICKLYEIDNYRLVFNHGVDYCYENRFDIAQTLFLELENIKVTVELFQRICDCYIKLGAYTKALEYAEKALALDTDNKRTAYMKSVIVDKLKGE